MLQQRRQHVDRASATVVQRLVRGGRRGAFGLGLQVDRGDQRRDRLLAQGLQIRRTDGRNRRRRGRRSQAWVVALDAARSGQRAVVTFGGVEARGEIIVRIAVNLLVFLGRFDVLAVALIELAHAKARLVRVMTLRIALEIVLRGGHPFIFELDAPHPAPLPFQARNLEEHVRGPLGVGIIGLARDVLRHLLDHVHAAADVKKIGGILVGLGIFAAARGGPIHIRGRQVLMFVVRNVGAEPVLETVAQSRRIPPSDRGRYRAAVATTIAQSSLLSSRARAYSII